MLLSLLLLLRPFRVAKVARVAGAKIRGATVDEYAEAMEQKAQFPAVTVFYDGTDHWLVDGFHRVAAAKKKGETRISAVIRPGSLLQAQLYSFGVNKTHGLRRTNDDKRRAVKATLEHDLSNNGSDRAIADHCGVDNNMVARIRAEIESRVPKGQVTKRGGKDEGKFNVENTKPPIKPEPPPITYGELLVSTPGVIPVVRLSKVKNCPAMAFAVS